MSQVYDIRQSRVYQEAREEGYKEGFERGFKEGFKMGIAIVIARMAAKNLSGEEIATILEVELEQVQNVIVNAGRN